MRGVLTPAERQLGETAEGVEIVKRLREYLIAKGWDMFCEQISDIIGAKVLPLFMESHAPVRGRLVRLWGGSGIVERESSVCR